MSSRASEHSERAEGSDVGFLGSTPLKRRSARNDKGFTLVEVLMTAVVLALGTILLHQTYLKLADLYGRYASSMRLQGWVSDQLWDAREAVVYSPDAETRSAAGSVEIDSKNYDWNRQIRAVSGRGLYSIRLNVSWFEGNRPAQLSREIYAFRKDP